MKYTALIALSTLILNCLHGANYISYNRSVNKIDEYILSDSLYKTIPVLDELDRNYSFIYARHCIKALQICNSSNDEYRSGLWLKRSILAGVPAWYFRNLPSLKGIFRFNSCRAVFNRYDSLKSIYRSRINLKLSEYIDSLFVTDQLRTNRVNNGTPVLRYTVYGLQWLHNNTKQWHIIESIINTYGYPGEQLTGLSKDYEDSSKQLKNGQFMFTQFDEYKVYYMLIHCYSQKRKSMDPLLLNAVKNGTLPAYQYASINDFMASYGYRSYRTYFYNQWHNDPDKSRYAQIDLKRSELGLNSIEQHEKIDQINFNRFREKTYYQLIFLE